MGLAPAVGLPRVLRACRPGLFMVLWAGLLGQACGGAGQEKEFRFVVYGGSQGTGPAHHAVVAQIVKLRPELVLHAGGLVGGGRQASDWKRTLAVTKPLREICSFYGCRGRYEKSAFCEPRQGLPQPQSKGLSYYSFDHRGVHFIALDTELRVSRDDEQTEWLREDLPRARASHVVVFSHRAVFGAAGRNTIGNGRMFWHPLFVKHKVRAVFSGGRHLYHRTSQDGVAYFVTGGGGPPLDPVMARRSLLPTDVAGSFHHCIEFTVSKDQLRGRAVDTEGKTRDEFVLPAAPAAPPPAR